MKAQRELKTVVLRTEYGSLPLANNRSHMVSDIRYFILILLQYFTDVIIGHGGTLLVGSASGNLRLWSVVGVSEMRLPGETTAR